MIRILATTTALALAALSAGAFDNLGLDYVSYCVADDELPEGAYNNQENVADVNILLGSLADNGGQTDTYALEQGSVAIDAGSNPQSLAYDQRGPGYPRTSGGGTDVGAYEVKPPPSGSVIVIQ